MFALFNCRHTSAGDVGRPISSDARRSVCASSSAKRARPTWPVIALFAPARRVMPSSRAAIASIASCERCCQPSGGGSACMASAMRRFFNCWNPPTPPSISLYSRAISDSSRVAWMLGSAAASPRAEPRARWPRIAAARRSGPCSGIVGAGRLGRSTTSPMISSTSSGMSSSIVTSSARSAASSIMTSASSASIGVASVTSSATRVPGGISGAASAAREPSRAASSALFRASMRSAARAASSPSVSRNDAATGGRTASSAAPVGLRNACHAVRPARTPSPMTWPPPPSAPPIMPPSMASSARPISSSSSLRPAPITAPAAALFLAACAMRPTALVDVGPGVSTAEGSDPATVPATLDAGLRAVRSRRSRRYRSRSLSSGSASRPGVSARSCCRGVV